MTQFETFHSEASAQQIAGRPQVAALCWRFRRGQVQFLLITSRETGRWVIPKGWPIDGRTWHEAAQIEAWEEAGVRGDIDTAALGVFHYDKRHVAKPSEHCEVAVYPLRVTRLEHKFPEKRERRRKWFNAAKAAKSVAETELSALFLSAAKALKKA